MTDARLRENSESRWRRIRIGSVITAIILWALLLILGHFRRLSDGDADWAACAFGLCYALHLATDVRRGRTQIPSNFNDPKYDYVRSADRVGFWVLIGLQGAVAAAFVIAAVANLLGLWKLSI